ncbi:COG0553: Superfamily II DNA/RNA helicases, SNF2 family [Janthinobacterium sp. CG23_2]|nr:COG0553: Superfamily II DNA/RNA helicases, SNF2 family [Janthinobacterium sp. CG23_2]CUU30945.1 COG0553: Superfamily II DNA/RNA helicases, SNF2 family [Janthinobacterium sp. CG23_2]
MQQVHALAPPACGDNSANFSLTDIPMQIPYFDQADILNNIDDATCKRGSDYFRRGKVQACHVNGKDIEGVVDGSGRYVYEQTVYVSDDGGVMIDGSCTCPMEYNCKHVVAVLYAYLEQQAVQVPSGAALPYASSAWLDRLVQATSLPQREAVVDKAVSQLVFVFVPGKQGELELVVCRSRARPGGGYTSASAISHCYELAVDASGARQRALVRLFLALRPDGDSYGTVAQPREALGAQLLSQLLDEGLLLQAGSRKELKGKLRPLVRGARRAAALAWRPENKVMRLVWEAEGGAIGTILPTDPPMYLHDGQLGELEMPAALRALPAATLLDMVKQAPQVEAVQAVRLAAEMQALQLDRLMPLPPAMGLTVREDIRPTPYLLLGSMEQSIHGGRESAWHDYAVLAFDYDGKRASVDASQVLMRTTASGSERIERDHHAEALAHATLAGYGFQGSSAPALERFFGALELASTDAWLAFGRSGLPALREQGWLLELAPSFRFDVRQIDDWYADVEQGGEGNAWFELELGIVVDGERVPLLPILLQLIRGAPAQFDAQAMAAHADDEVLMARLPGGGRVGLPWSRIRPILSTLGELYFLERVGNAIRLPSLDAARLAELEASARLRWMGGETLRSLGRRLAGFGGVQAVAPPRGLHATLRTYQQEGLAWMQFLREYGLAGILADDMGLGKTIQTLSHILLEKEAGRLDRPALVVAPTSLMGNWQEEAARFAPALRVLLLHGPDRAARFDSMGSHDLVLTTYALLARDEAALLGQEFHLLILDESQYIKNHRSKAAETATLLRARHRLCLTGTPLQNHLGELWSQFHFLLPGLLGDEKQFNSDFRKPVERDGDAGRNAFLTRRIKPFLLRRTKDHVAKELPAKTEMLREVTLAGAQRDLYETVRLAMDKKVRAAIASKGVARSQIVILEALLKLRQVCCDPRLVSLAGGRKSGAQSAKLAELTVMLDELLDEGRKILVFSQFTSMLALIEDELRARKIGYALLTGDTKDRSAQVAAFQSGAVPVFLISLKAGGVGLNLTAADTVIHYDPWWNPAVENQATDRAWRIGQDKPVFVYKLIAKATLEEKIQEMQQRKAALASAVLSGGDTEGLQITQDDLQAIFAPLSAQAAPA